MNIFWHAKFIQLINSCAARRINVQCGYIVFDNINHNNIILLYKNNDSERQTLLTIIYFIVTTTINFTFL